MLHELHARRSGCGWSASFGAGVGPEPHLSSRCQVPHRQSFKASDLVLSIATSNVHGGSDNADHPPQRPLYLRNVVRRTQADSAVELFTLLASVACMPAPRSLTQDQCSEMPCPASLPGHRLGSRRDKVGAGNGVSVPLRFVGR